MSQIKKNKLLKSKKLTKVDKSKLRRSNTTVIQDKKYQNYKKEVMEEIEYIEKLDDMFTDDELGEAELLLRQSKRGGKGG